MSVSVLTTVLAATGSVGGVGGFMALLNHRVARRQMKSAAEASVMETAKGFNDMALALLAPLRSRADEAEAQVIAIGGQLAEIKEVVMSLSDTNQKATAELVELRKQLAVRDAELAIYRRSEPLS